MILGQLFFTFKGIETFPFRNYGMYSEPLVTPIINNEYVVYINDSVYQLNELPGINHAFLKNNLDYYGLLKAHNFIDPIESTIDARFKNDAIQEFFVSKLANKDSVVAQNWFRNYLQSRTGWKIERLRINQNNSPFLIY